MRAGFVMNTEDLEIKVYTVAVDVGPVLWVVYCTMLTEGKDFSLHFWRGLRVADRSDPPFTVGRNFFHALILSKFCQFLAD